MLTSEQQKQVDNLVEELNNNGDGFNDIAMSVILLIASLKITPPKEKD